MYPIVFLIHVIVSVITLSLGISSIGFSIYHQRKSLPFKPINKRLGRSFVASMYVQLIVGLSLYYYPWPDKSSIERSAIDPGNSAQIRFWEIEHVAIMIFALFLVQIGCIFVSKTKNARKKYLLTYWYFGTSLALMVFTMLMAIR